MSVDAIIEQGMNELPKALGIGVVDMATGMLMGHRTVDAHPPQILDLVAAATRELFEGDNISTIENYFKQIRGDSPDTHYFSEIITVSKNLIHVWGRLKTAPNVVLVGIVRSDAPLGMVLVKFRQLSESGTV